MFNLSVNVGSKPSPLNSNTVKAKLEDKPPSLPDKVNKGIPEILDNTSQNKSLLDFRAQRSSFQKSLTVQDNKTSSKHMTNSSSGTGSIFASRGGKNQPSSRVESLRIDSFYEGDSAEELLHRRIYRETREEK